MRSKQQEINAVAIDCVRGRLGNNFEFWNVKGFYFI